MYDKMLKI